jgi:HK97 family phage portal protein
MTREALSLSDKSTALARAWGALRSYWSGPITSNSPELARLWADPPVTSGVAVNEQTALNYSAVWAAVQRISGDVGSLPLVLYKRVGDGKEPLRDHPTYRLLHDQPNPDMTAVVFRETLQAHLLTWGNAYAEIEWRGDGRPNALWPIEPNRVTPERTAGGGLRYKVQGYNKADVYFAPEDMLHIPGLGFDGTCGYSVIQKARESIGLGIAMEKFGGAFFGNGTTFGGILTHSARLSDAARKNIRESFNSKHQGVHRAHNFALLEEGMTYTPLGVPPDDAQFLETRRFQVTEIARWFQIPPHMLADLERATFSNIEQQQIDYYTGTLRRWLVRWEQEINRKLVLQQGTQFVEHVIDGLLRGDIESRYAAYAVGRQWGWLSADDVRSKENLNPLPSDAGKIYLVPINMAPADRINEVIDAQVAPAPAPVVGGGGVRSGDAEIVEKSITALAEQRESVDRILEALILREAAIKETEARLAEAGIELGRIGRQLSVAVTAPEADIVRLQEARMAHELATQQLRDQLDKHVTERDDFVRELSAIRQSADADKDARTKAEALAADREQQATTAAQRAEDLRVEWIRAQEAHQVKALEDAQMLEAARADLARAVETTVALEGDVQDRTGQLDDAKAAKAAAEQEADTLRGIAAALATDKAVSDAEKDAAIALALKADERALDAQDAARLAGVALVEAQAARDAATEALGVTEAQLSVAKGQLKATRDEATTRLASVLGSHRALIADAVGRMARRQAEKARRYQATPEKLRRWLETFATVEAPICVEAILPAVRTHLAWMQSTADPATVTVGIVKAHLDAFEGRLKSAADAEPDEFHATLEAVLQRWEADRPTEVADAILQEGIAYVRAS